MGRNDSPELQGELGQAFTHFLLLSFLRFLLHSLVHPIASGHLHNCDTLSSRYRGPWSLPSHLWVSLCEIGPGLTGHWTDFCIPQAKSAYNRPAQRLSPRSLSCLSPPTRAFRDNSQKPSQALPSQVLGNMAWLGSLPAPRTAAHGLVQSCLTMGFTAAIPAHGASPLSALALPSPSPLGGSSSCLVERLCEQGLQQLRPQPYSALGPERIGEGSFAA